MSHDFVLTEEDAPSGNTHAEDILELSYHTMAYNLHAVMCKALRLEFDDVPERIQEVPVPKDGKLAADWAGSAWAR